MKKKRIQRLCAIIETVEESIEKLNHQTKMLKDMLYDLQHDAEILPRESDERAETRHQSAGA